MKNSYIYYLPLFFIAIATSAYASPRPQTGPPITAPPTTAPPGNLKDFTNQWIGFAKEKAKNAVEQHVPKTFVNTDEIKKVIQEKMTGAGDAAKRVIDAVRLPPLTGTQPLQ